jgi:hypothetical protein
MFSKPKICLINTTKSVLDKLCNTYLGIYDGNFGRLIQTGIRLHYETRKIFLDFLLPNNLHEYDMFIIDMTYDLTVPYNEDAYILTDNKNKSQVGILCEYPQVIFDGRPIVSTEFFSKKIWDEQRKIFIVFASRLEIINYDIADFSKQYHEVIETRSISNFDFFSDSVQKTNKQGKEIKVLNTEFKQILDKYSLNSEYHVIFNFTTHPSYIPLLENNKNEIVGYLYKFNSSYLFVLPDFSKKGEFLEEFLSQTLPDFVPDFFPENTEAHWIKSDDFTLPEVAQLQARKMQLLNDVEKEILRIDKEIHAKMIEFQFLHDLIRESSATLVESVKKMLDYIGFDLILNVDEIDQSALKEEDIKILEKEKILIIEVKGINGTSTDSDCSQISKVRYRKMKELKRTDVNALYIVNHQRFLPPTSRQNPPFNDIQINDAVNDDRGLLTTWELYKAYGFIQKEILTKSDIQEQIFQIGLIRFLPSTKYKSLGIPNEIHRNGKVFILKLFNNKLVVGQRILIQTDNDFIPSIIKEIMFNDENLEIAENGEFGFLIDKTLKRNNKIWIPKLY